jgi:hypothetical protein
LKNKDAEIIILSIPKNFHYYNHGWKKIWLL